MPETIEATGATETKSESVVSNPPRRRSAPWPMLVVALVAIGAGFLTAKFVVLPAFSDGVADRGPLVDGAIAARGEIVTFDNIIVNPSGTMGRRFLNATIGLEARDGVSREAIKSGRAKILDILNAVLSSRTVDQLSDPRSRESLRAAIMEKVNQQIAPGEVVGVYFLDFVLQ